MNRNRKPEKLTPITEAEFRAELKAGEPELTPEGAAKLASILSRPGKRIPKLAALLKGRP